MNTLPVVGNKRPGFGLIGLLLAILLIGFMSMQYFKAPGGTMSGSGPAAVTPIQAIDKAWDATCKVNIMRINQQLQMYAIAHEPMTELDLAKLFSPNPPPTQASGCPCRYSFDQNRNVVCAAHP